VIIDTHSHLFGKSFQNDIQAVMFRALDAGITKLLLPNVDSETIPELYATLNSFPEICRAMMGIHPCSILPETMESELHAAENELNKGSWVGVGEIGLDLYWEKKFVELQIEALQIQCEWAIARQLPVSLHTRNANRETIDVIAPFAQRGLKGVFHCFSGTIHEAHEMTSMGFMLGIGGVLTFKNGGLKPVLEQIDPKHIVLETDAPYLAPQPYRGKRNEPAYLSFVVQHLAELWALPTKEVEQITSNNAIEMFKL